MSKYFQFRLNIRERFKEEGGKQRNTHYIAPMKHCDVNEFKNKGIRMDETDEQLISQRICPNVTEDIMPFFKTVNSYNNNTYRSSYSIEVVTC